ncbi:MAG: glycogen synthase GlgA [Ardenticatenia bacterium]|jgi:starch synthase|nr:MAG: glycogen synthase GlgA [Ardenticatenia bacterium]
MSETNNVSQPLKILLLAAEVVPFVKTGGLADVTGSLPPAVRALGHDIRVVMPRYSRIDPRRFNLTLLPTTFAVPIDNRTELGQLHESRLAHDVPIYFVENARYFDREGLYMYPDDAERFIFFCRGALEGVRQLGWQPDVIHCHDWQTALVPNWLKTTYAQDPFFARTASVYTIHSLAFRGVFGRRVLEIAGIAEYEFTASPDGTRDGQVVDFMARGITYADVINTVSPTYAREILTPEFGESLDGLLRQRQDRLFGILNGLDVEDYNPATDPHIARHYTAETLEQRAENKAALQRYAGLEVVPDVPLLGAISRLTDDKGFDLIQAALEPMLQHLPIQFVLMGTGEERYHRFFLDLAQRHPGRVAVFLTFNTPLARRIYAGTDIFLMPSRFEPCGLGQMIAMRYGSVPLVRAVGGLVDTVQDYDPATQTGTGFLFRAYDAWAFYAAVVRAVETYRYADVWRRLQQRGMQQDFSWQASARAYVDLYRLARALRAQTEGMVPRTP